MKTAIRESCLDLFGGEFCISTDSSSPRDEKWILLQCGICVVSSSSTLDSTSKIKAECFLSSVFWMGFLQARKQAGMLYSSEGPSVFLSAGLLYFAFIHPPGMLFRRDTKRYVMGPQHHWALHSWIQSFADQKYSQKGLHLWWASRNSLPLAIYANSFSQNIYVVLVLRVVCRWFTVSEKMCPGLMQLLSYVIWGRFLTALDTCGVSEWFLFNTQGSPSWLVLTHTDPVSCILSFKK